MKLLIHSQTSTVAPMNLGRDKWFYPTFCRTCNYSSMLGSEWILVSKKGSWWCISGKMQNWNVDGVCWSLIGIFFSCQVWSSRQTSCQGKTTASSRPVWSSISNRWDWLERRNACSLTHWPLVSVAMVWKMQFSKPCIPWIISWGTSLKLLLRECLIILLLISQHWFR